MFAMKNAKFRRFVLLFVAIITISFIVMLTSIYLKNKVVNKSNVILIVIDALRPDHLSCYGYKRHTSPNIDRLSEEGVRFTRAIAQSSSTQSSLPSIFTSTYPSLHGMAVKHLKPSKLKTIVQILNQNGYTCGLISNHPILNLIDIKQGFSFIKISKKRKDFNAEELVGIAVDFIKGNSDKNPYFLYLHFFGTHKVYTAPAPYDEKFMGDEFMPEPKHVPICPEGVMDTAIGCIALNTDITDCNRHIAIYDGVLAYVDAQIGRLIKAVRNMQYDKNTVVVITADHGEAMGEQNYYFEHSGGFVCEACIRVPLIIWSPALFTGGIVIDRQIEHIDLIPTLLDFLGLERERYMQGESFLSLITKDNNYGTVVFNKPLYAFSEDSQSHSVIIPEWQLIYDEFKNGYMLFNLKDDPMQLHNLLGEELDDEARRVFYRLKTALEEWMEDGRKGRHNLLAGSQEKQDTGLNEEEVNMLKSLGYLH